jgi:hypothetical protein
MMPSPKIRRSVPYPGAIWLHHRKPAVRHGITEPLHEARAAVGREASRIAASTLGAGSAHPGCSPLLTWPPTSAPDSTPSASQAAWSTCEYDPCISGICWLKEFLAFGSQVCLGGCWLRWMVLGEGAAGCHLRLVPGGGGNSMRAWPREEWEVFQVVVIEPAGCRTVGGARALLSHL